MTVFGADFRTHDPLLRRLVHDLRGPARALVDIPDWLGEDGSSAQSDRLLRLLSENARRLDAILQGLSDWIEAGHPVPVTTPAADPIAVLSACAAAAECALEFDLGALPLSAPDLVRIGSAVLGNACRFHPNRRPTVHVSGGMSDCGWTLCFRDDGLGPPMPDPAPLLAPLAHAAVGASRGGPGFGLAIVSRIASRYRATVEVSAGPDGRGMAVVLSGFT